MAEIVGGAVDTYLTGAQWQTMQVMPDGNAVVMYDCTGFTCPDFPTMQYPVLTYSVGFTESDIDPAPWIGWTYYGTFGLAFALSVGFAVLGFKFGYSLLFKDAK